MSVRCIEKFRDKNNNIIGYRLQDSHGSIRDVEPNQLKQAILNKRIIIDNLTLTSDNRLIDKAEPEKPQLSKSEALLLKAKVLGYTIKEIGDQDQKIYILINNSDAIYLIPDTTTKVPEIDWESSNITGTLKVIGGKNLKDASEMFNGCEAKSIDLSLFDTSNVENMYYMFCYCKRLQYLDLSSLVTSKVKNMTGMFDDCDSLQSLDLSSFDTSNVKNMYAMFSNCQSLQSLDLNNFNTSKVKVMRYMFDDCKNLQSLNLSSFDTSSVEDMFSMFRNCESLQSLDLSSFNTSSVEDMRGIFDGCNSLKSLKGNKYIQKAFRN